jgi:hypothetical protein
MHQLTRLGHGSVTGFPARPTRQGGTRALSALLAASTAIIAVVAACSGGNSSSDDGRCRDGMCCDPGERMASGYPKGCPHGGKISRCERPGDNCISRTEDGQYAINCWSVSCSDCPYAPDYGLLVQWCSEN